jgi:hypothetical protein
MCVSCEDSGDDVVDEKRREEAMLSALYIFLPYGCVLFAFFKGSFLRPHYSSVSAQPTCAHCTITLTHLSKSSKHQQYPRHQNSRIARSHVFVRNVCW